MEKKKPTKSIDQLRKAHRILSGEYQRPLTNAEKASVNHSIVQKLKERRRSDAAIAEQKRIWREEAKIDRADINELITEGETGMRKETGTLYAFYDRKEFRAYIYNGDGDLVDDRPLNNEEAQMVLAEGFGEEDSGTIPHPAAAANQ